jgi:hypothetical protein
MHDNRAPIEGNWSLIWKLSIPSKVKHIFWRMARDYLPHRVNLLHRGTQAMGSPATSIYPGAGFHKSLF